MVRENPQSIDANCKLRSDALNLERQVVQLLNSMRIEWADKKSRTAEVTIDDRLYTLIEDDISVGETYVKLTVSRGQNSVKITFEGDGNLNVYLNNSKDVSFSTLRKNDISSDDLQAVSEKVAFYLQQLSTENTRRETNLVVETEVRQPLRDLLSDL